MIRRFWLSFFATILGAAPFYSYADDKDPKQTLFFFAQGNPAGLAFQYDLELPWRGPFLVGLNYAYYVYTGAAELSVRYRYLGGLIDILAGAGVEGGTYYQLDKDETLPTYDQLQRELGIKEFARVEGKLNLKLDKLWIYGRFSPTLRFRDYNEIDLRRMSVLQEEYSQGEALAAIFLVRRGKEPSSPKGWTNELWAYAEYTRETVRHFASADAVVLDGKDIAISRPSVGLIGYAPFGWERLSYDLDLYYSLIDRNLFLDSDFLNPNLKGFGAQLFIWWNY